MVWVEYNKLNLCQCSEWSISLLIPASSTPVLLYVALCCFVLFCVALCCFVLLCVVLCCFVLFCVALCCFVLLCVRFDERYGTFSSKHYELIKCDNCSFLRCDYNVQLHIFLEFKYYKVNIYTSSLNIILKKQS